jgi:hypothetical protein
MPYAAERAAIAASSMGEGEQAQITPFDPHLASSIQDGSSTLFLVNQNAQTGNSVAGSGEEGRWQATLQPSVVSILQPSGVSTFNAGFEGAGESVLQEGGVAALHDARQILLQTGADPLGPGLGEYGNGVAGLPGFDAGGGGLTVLAGGRESVDGMFDPGRPPFLLQFLLDAGSEPFGFPDHAPGEPGMSSYVASSDGSDGSDGSDVSAAGMPFAQGNLPGAAAMQYQSFNFAARGGPPAVHLLGKISSSPNSPTTESGTTGASSASSSEFFVSMIQHQEDQDSASAVAVIAQGSLTAGMAPFSDSTFASVPASPDSPAQKSEQTIGDTFQLSPEETATVIAAFDQSASGSQGGFDSRIPTGPLASRNAGPLGPILASTGGDPTPEVDRDERALYQAIERGESEAGNNQDALESLNTAGGSSDDATSELGGSVAVVPGAGGFPLNVTALPRSRTTEPGGLLSSIRTGTASPSTPLDAALAARSLDPGQVAEVAPNRDDSPAFAVFIKAACGIALGLGMSSRAFFPSLLTGAQKRIRTRLRNLQSKSSRR